MSLSDSELWQRIENFDIDEVDIDLPFSKRLARENSWPGEFALRVIEEYKKFTYLACVSEKAVTPSDEVDQAWHLHLVYTQSYWCRFCNQILKRELHHNPTQGGPQELEKFEDWYAYTKALYEQEFETPPPRDIWPPSSERFSRPLHMKRIDMSENYIIKKSFISELIQPPLILFLWVLLTLSSTAVLAVETTRDLDPFNKTFAGIVCFLMLMGIFIGFIVLLNKGAPPRDRGGGSCGGGCGGHGCGGGCGH